MFSIALFAVFLSKLIRQPHCVCSGIGFDCFCTVASNIGANCSKFTLLKRLWTVAMSRGLLELLSILLFVSFCVKSITSFFLFSNMQTLRLRPEP